VYHWIDADGERSGNANVNKSPRIFWSNGSADTGKTALIIVWCKIDAEDGTGKTTIAYTVAEVCRANKILGATFFCSRYSAERSNPNLIFTTIAHQLGQLFPPFKLEISRTRKSHPNIGSSSVPYQLEELIVKPLHSVGDPFPPCLVILEDLDECKDDRVTSIILSSLSPCQ
jgi:hypothetical protein